MSDIDTELDEILPGQLPCDIHETMDSCPVIEAKSALKKLMLKERRDELLTLYAKFTDIRSDGTNGPETNRKAMKTVNLQIAELDKQIEGET